MPIEPLVTVLVVLIVGGLLALVIAGPEGTDALLGGIARIVEAITGRPPWPQP